MVKPQPLHLALAAWVLLAFQEGVSAALSEAECLAAGFDSKDLLCPSCDDLPQFQLRHLQSDCRECCKDDGNRLQSGNNATKYPKAVLEVCG